MFTILVYIGWDINILTLATGLESDDLEEVQSVLNTEVQSVFNTEIQAVVSTEVQSVFNIEIKAVLDTMVQTVLDTEVQPVLDTKKVVGRMSGDKGCKIDGDRDGIQKSERRLESVQVRVARTSIAHFMFSGQGGWRSKFQDVTFNP